ncbi:hypothetical protein IV102_30665 [bacterium]|nr:hypothetical protein [bacterium]
MLKARTHALALLAALTCAGLALADVVRPTVSGVIQSAIGNRVVILSETGTVWTAQFEPNSKCEWMGSNRTLSSIPKGAKVMLRVVGSMADKPLKVDLLTDWGSSSKYVATQAPSPYYTRMGDMAGPGGVGGRAPNSPDLAKPKNVGAYAANGGFPHQQPEIVPNIAAPAAQNPGVARVSKGTPGFEMGPVPPAPNPSAAQPQPQPQYQPEPSLSPPPPQSYDPSMNPGMMNPGANPYMSTNQPGVMNPYMTNNYNPNQTGGLESLLNGDDPDKPDQGGPMFPGVNSMAQGTPVQMQATVLRCDPATRSLVVQAVGTQIPQNVVVNPQMMMPMLREGQTVTISGTSNPQGFIEAQQVTPLGQ